MYHDEGAVEVETLSTAFGHHEPASPVTVPQHGYDKQQHIEAGVPTQEQQLTAVVVPVGSGQVPRSLMLLLIQIRWLQPVSSTKEEDRGERQRQNKSESRRAGSTPVSMFAAVVE